MYIKTQKCSFWCNDKNCSYVGKICTFFLWKGQGHFWGIRIKIHLGRPKGRGKRENGGRSPKWGGVFFFCKIPFIKQYTNFISHCSSDKLLTTTIAIDMPENLCAKTLKWFWAVLPGQKQFCVFLRNKHGFQIGNAIEKMNYFDQDKMLKMAWYSMHIGFWTCQFQWHRFWGLYIQMFLSYGLYVCIIL